MNHAFIMTATAVGLAANVAAQEPKQPVNQIGTTKVSLENLAYHEYEPNTDTCFYNAQGMNTGRAMRDQAVYNLYFQLAVEDTQKFKFFQAGFNRKYHGENPPQPNDGKEYERYSVNINMHNYSRDFLHNTPWHVEIKGSHGKIEHVFFLADYLSGAKQLKTMPAVNNECPKSLPETK